MAINKVVYKGDILIDLTTDTVSPETLAVGATAHDKSGELIVGTFEGGGTDTSDATASASDIMLDKTAYTADGKTTGTFTIDDELNTQSNLLTQIVSALENKTAGGSVEVEPKLQDKTITANGSYTADDGYDGLGTVNVNVAQSTPTITVSSTGLITASADSKSATKQLTTLAAKTITPSTVSQTAVSGNVYTTGAITVGAIPSDYVKPTAKKAAATYTPGTSNQTIDSGTYLTGTQTIRGDANLKAENIKLGVSIFGINGTASGAEDLETELTEQESLISQLSTILDSKASGSGSGGSSSTASRKVTFLDYDLKPSYRVCYTDPSGKSQLLYTIDGSEFELEVQADSYLAILGSGDVDVVVLEGELSDQLYATGWYSLLHVRSDFVLM